MTVSAGERSVDLRDGELASNCPPSIEQSTRASRCKPTWLGSRCLVLAARDPRGPSNGGTIVTRSLIEAAAACFRHVDVHQVVGRLTSASGHWTPPPNAHLHGTTPIGLAGLGRMAFSLARGRSANASLGATRYREVHRIREAEYDLEIVDLVRAAGSLRPKTEVPRVVHLQDLLSDRYLRESSFEGDSLSVGPLASIARVPFLGSLAKPAAQRLLITEAGRLYKEEVALAKQADAVLLSGREESLALDLRCGHTTTTWMPIPTTAREAGPNISTGPIQLRFLGRLDYEPNIRALEEISRRILPDLRQVLPAHDVEVAGALDDERVAVRLAKLPGLRLLGYIDDLDAFLDSSTILIAAMSDPGGAKVKVIDTLLRGGFVVAPHQIARGLGLRDCPGLLTCENPEDYRRAVQGVIDLPVEERISRARTTASLAERIFGQESVAARYRHTFDQALKSREV